MNEYAIICVDDEPLILDTLKIQFRKFYGNQYFLEVAQSVEEAWEVIDDLIESGVSIGVIVSDWLMPGVKGDKFLIDVHSKYPDVIKILLTGQADKDAVEKVKNEIDLHCCLYKPWSENDLYKVVNKGMERICSQR